MSQRAFDRISVVGLGYIGLPTAAMFASCEIEVVGVDTNQEAVDTINRGEIHIVEPNLDSVVRKAVDEGYLRATTMPEPADAFLIAVPTPFKGSHNEPDLSYIKAACKAVAQVLEKGNLVVLESTSPVGTTETMVSWLAEERPDLSFPRDKSDASDIRVAYCPERVLPGKVMEELITNDRIIGGISDACSARAALLYNIFVTGSCIKASGPRVAEMSKLTENAFRDVNIAFANELSLICERLSLGVWELIELANRHPRVNILQPGPGVGGHCIAVDPWFIISSAPEQARLVRAAREVNQAKPEWVITKIKEQVGDFLEAHPGASESDVSVVCFGLAFKADVDDFRESPALQIVRQLQISVGVQVTAVEPHLSPGIEVGCEVVSLESGLNGDVLVLLVDHQEFRNIRPKSKFIVDTRGGWSPKSH